MASAKMLNEAKWLRRIASLPEAVTSAVDKQITEEADEMVAAMKRAAPYDAETADQDQHLRDSIHQYPTPNRPLSHRILADAKDEATGNFIGPHVEHGHKAKDGSHVPARPFFFPTYRARKKRMHNRVRAAGRRVIKQIWPE